MIKIRTKSQEQKNQITCFRSDQSNGRISLVGVNFLGCSSKVEELSCLVWISMMGPTDGFVGMA